MSTPRTTATPAVPAGRTTEPGTAEHAAAPGSRGGGSPRPAVPPHTVTTSATEPPGVPTPATATTGRVVSRTRTPGTVVSRVAAPRVPSPRLPGAGPFRPAEGQGAAAPAFGLDGVPTPRREVGRRPAPAGSAWLPGAPCSPRGCVESARPWTGAPRSALRLGALLSVVLVGVLLTPLVGRLRVARRDRWIRRWCLAVVRAAGVRTRITGAAPPTGGLLIVANHISWLDIPLLAAVRPARMLAKTEVRGWPVVGAVAARGGTLFIDRDRLRALPGTVERIAGALRGGAAVVVFPEGSTWCGRAQGRYRRAVFQAALDAGTPVQPVRVRYRFADGTASTAPAFVGEDALLTSLWRVVSARGLVAEIDLSPTLAPDDHPDRRTLAAAAQGTPRAAGSPPGTHP
ncbi:1-acyl-sn-glycerol-3-phosphate acyltransferase [Streptomyces sp. NPDC091879]|uniref:lysophospholipid acyltransferase family protein n=1 Tax=Streptomyces sp. NPDC091879 TaxID=3366006 RepID=UPI00382277A2